MTEDVFADAIVTDDDTPGQSSGGPAPANKEAASKHTRKDSKTKKAKGKKEITRKPSTVKRAANPPDGADTEEDKLVVATLER